MDVPKDQIINLIDHGHCRSAQMLGCFLISSSTINADSSPQLKSENLVLYGDALLHDKEYRRAIYTYKQALQGYKTIPKHNAITSRSTLSTSIKSSSSSCSISAVNENEVKFKIATCHCALNDAKAALAEMDGIPSKARNLQMNLTLGKLYRNSGHKRAASTCYKDCLRQCPYIIEAIVALAELEVPSKDIISSFPQTPNRSGKPPFDQFDSSRWLQRYVEAQCCVASNDYKGGLEHFSELLHYFPNNLHILLEVAKIEAIIGKNDEAIVNFEKARLVDPYIITYMDEYAMLLKTKHDPVKINKLVHDLVNTDPSRPEVFVALSVLLERKDGRGALSFVEKGIKVDERHVPAYIMKGQLLSSMNRPEAAVAAYRRAHDLRPDLRSYQGLIHSYLTLSKTKEALHYARVAMKVMPQSAKALKLLADVYATNPAGRDRAKKLYESALRLEPGDLRVAVALAEVHLCEGRNGDAVSLLERYLNDWADDSLNVKLAQVFAATNMLPKALSHFQAALRINPTNESAKRGLDRLEKQINGLDPDAPEEDEENEVEEDQEEAEL